MDETKTRDNEYNLLPPQIQAGDKFLDKPLTLVQPINPHMTELFWESDDAEEGQALAMQVSNTLPIPILRTEPLKQGQCIECGALDKKIVAKDKCTTCYQRGQRAARSD